MANQDREKQERLLAFAGWLNDRHERATRVHGQAFSEVRFTRKDLGRSSVFDLYAPDKGEASERAFGRDVNDLASFGIEVRWDPVEKEWVSRSWTLTDEECRALATAALSVIVEDGASGPSGLQVPGSALSPEGAERIVAYAPITDLLIGAIRSLTAVDIVHRGRHRTIDPWHLSMVDGRWLLVGYDHKTDEERTFAVDAITSAGTVGASGAYRIPKRDFAAVAGGAGDPDEWTSADPVNVDLEVDRRLIVRATELLNADMVEASGSSGEWVPMQCTIRNVDAFVDRLWGLRARAVVVGPLWLRERIVSTLKERL